MAAIYFRAYVCVTRPNGSTPSPGVDRAWMSEIGCRFSPHKYADVKQRLPRMARPVPAQGSTNHRDHLLRVTFEQA
jgi:hypothetical protein